MTRGRIAARGRLSRTRGQFAPTNATEPTPSSHCSTASALEPRRRLRECAKFIREEHDLDPGNLIWSDDVVFQTEAERTVESGFAECWAWPVGSERHQGWRERFDWGEKPAVRVPELESRRRPRDLLRLSAEGTSGPLAGIAVESAARNGQETPASSVPFEAVRCLAGCACAVRRHFGNGDRAIQSDALQRAYLDRSPR